MQFQGTQASCGPAALRNALRVRGIHRSVDELGQLAGYRPDYGTGSRGLIKALKLIAVDNPEIQAIPVHETRSDIALLKLRQAHSDGLAAILCVQDWSHWVCSFGMLGGVFHIADSADNEMVAHLAPSDLIATWRGPSRRPFYGILV